MWDLKSEEEAAEQDEEVAKSAVIVRDRATYRTLWLQQVSSVLGGLVGQELGTTSVAVRSEADEPGGPFLCIPPGGLAGVRGAPCAPLLTF